MKKTIGLIFWFMLLFMALSSCMGDGGAQLDGTSWELATLKNQQVLPGAPPTLFLKDGSVGGNAGCNNFGGEYKITGVKIQIGELFSTLMACVDNDRMEQETRYMQLLGQVDRFEIIDGRLILVTVQDETLVFVPGE